MAAPAETRTPNLHRAKKSLIESADGRMASVATRRGKILSNKKGKELLDSDRPSHGRRLHSSTWVPAQNVLIPSSNQRRYFPIPDPKQV